MNIHDDDCFGGDPDDYDMTASDRFALALNQAERDKAAMTSGAFADRLVALAAKMRAEAEEWGGLTFAEKWADELTAIANSEHEGADDDVQSKIERIVVPYCPKCASSSRTNPPCVHCREQIAAILALCAERNEDAFRAGFQAGFDVTREGFNGQCAYDHRAPSPHDSADDPVQSAEDAALREYIEGKGQP